MIKKALKHTGMCSFNSLQKLFMSGICVLMLLHCGPPVFTKGYKTLYLVAIHSVMT